MRPGMRHFVTARPATPEALYLLGDLPHRFEPAHPGGPRDQAKEGLGANSPDGTLGLGPEHTQVALPFWIVRDQEKRHRAAAPAPLPCRSHPALVYRPSVRVLDAVDQPACGDAVRDAGVPGPTKRGKAVKELVGVHQTQ